MGALVVALAPPAHRLAAAIGVLTVDAQVLGALAGWSAETAPPGGTGPGRRIR